MVNTESWCAHRPPFLTEQFSFCSYCRGEAPTNLIDRYLITDTMSLNPVSKGGLYPCPPTITHDLEPCSKTAL